MLSDLWRWSRRGGFGPSDAELTPSAQALQALQGRATAMSETADRVSSSLLDGLEISDAEKQEIGSALEGCVFVCLGCCCLFVSWSRNLGKPAQHPHHP